MANEAFREYWALRIQGATARLEAARKVIQHNLTRGTIVENVVRDLLGEFLPQGTAIGSGFIIDPDRGSSLQVDILLYDRNRSAPIYQDGMFVVISPDMVRAAVEVKSVLNKASLVEALLNVGSVKSLNRRVPGIVLGLKGMEAPTLEHHLAGPSRMASGGTYGSTFSPDLLPDNIYIFDRKLIVTRDASNAGRHYAAHVAGDPVAAHLIAAVVNAARVRNLQRYIDDPRTGGPVFTV